MSGGDHGLLHLPDTSDPRTCPYGAFLRFLWNTGKWYPREGQALRETVEESPFSTVDFQQLWKRSPWYMSPSTTVDYKRRIYLLARFRSLTNSADCWCRISLLLVSLSKALTNSWTLAFNFFSLYQGEMQHAVRNLRGRRWLLPWQRRKA